jgi:hypothetical protein
MFDWKRHRVCLAEGPAETYALLAIRPERRPDRYSDGQIAESETVIWDDGSHMRALPLAKVVTDEEGLFLFEDDRGQVFTLRPLTAALYAALVKAKVGGPELDTDEAAMEFYLAPRGW